jgi:hypothetical protein
LYLMQMIPINRNKAISCISLRQLPTCYGYLVLLSFIFGK